MQLGQSKMDSWPSGIIDRLRPWVEAETGMDFSGNRTQRLRDAADKVLSRQKTPVKLEQLLADSRQRGVFLEQLTAELTVGESFFFRNEHQFRALREQVLPEILSGNADKREVRIWSAGCATGEEPYSLAILLDQMLGGHHGWHVSILGTDLNPEFLTRAREACYRPWSFRHTDIHQNRTYFSPDRDTFRLASKVRDTARFTYLNLVKDVYPSPLTGTLGLDLILFRNVAIYLKPEVTQNIIDRFHQALRPGGWLLLGETEVSLAPTKGFEARRFEQATFHQKACGNNPATDRSPAPMPVLAEFVAAPSRRNRVGKSPAPQRSIIPAAPSIPDWLPLPKKHGAGARAAGSDVQRIEQLLAAHKFDDAERSIERIVDKQQRVKSRFRLAQELLMCASVARARQMLDRCLAEDPLMIEPHLLQASFAEEAGDLDRAEAAYRRALYIDRQCPMAHFHLALVQQMKGNAADSERSVKTTLKLIDHKDPHELVEYGEGVCYGRLKEMARMILES
ncbi:MAG TPA: CheR family methyltransferase [Pirellulaceae bacterium]|nr:CheR family methyltransferase [Pirellulaceae bacterium]